MATSNSFSVPSPTAETFPCRCVLLVIRISKRRSMGKMYLPIINPSFILKKETTPSAQPNNEISLMRNRAYHIFQQLLCRVDHNKIEYQTTELSQIISY